MEQLLLPKVFFSPYTRVFTAKYLFGSSQDDRFLTAQLRIGAPAAGGALSAVTVTGNSALMLAGFVPYRTCPF